MPHAPAPQNNTTILHAAPSPFTKIPAQLARLDTLRVITEKNEDDAKMKQLDELNKYLENMMNDYEKVS